MADLGKLVAEARLQQENPVIQEAVEIEQPTVGEIAEAREEAQQAVAQSREAAALKGQDEFDVMPFRPVGDIKEILENTLKAEFADANLVQTVCDSLAPICEKMNKTILTQEGRQMFAESMASTLKMQQEQKKLRQETEALTRDVLLKKRFGEEGMKTMQNSYNESLKKVFGEEGWKSVVASMPPETYVSRVVEHHNQEKQNYLSWRSGASQTNEYQGNLTGSLVEDKRVVEARNKILHAIKGH
jgi:hypothetical protein